MERTAVVVARVSNIHICVVYLFAICSVCDCMCIMQFLRDYDQTSVVSTGLAAELNNVNRKLFLFACILLWSIMTILGGLCTEYWHLAVTRLLVGIA